MWSDTSETVSSVRWRGSDTEALHTSDGLESRRVFQLLVFLWLVLPYLLVDVILSILL